MRWRPPASAATPKRSKSDLPPLDCALEHVGRAHRQLGGLRRLEVGEHPALTNPNARLVRAFTLSGDADPRPSIAILVASSQLRATGAAPALVYRGRTWHAIESELIY